jgi:tetratricopeptide (TPR) repeat protein
MNDGDLIKLLLQAEEKANANDLHSSSELYKRVTTLDPKNASAWYGFGVIQAKIGEREKAVQAFENAFELNSKHGPSAANLAVLIEKIDSKRSANLARIGIKYMGENSELIRLSNLHPVEPLPLIEASHVYTNINSEHQSQAIQTEAELPDLIAKPVIINNTVEMKKKYSIEDLIEKSREYLDSNLHQELLELLKNRLETDASENSTLWRYCGVALWELEMKEEAKNSLEFSLALGEKSKKSNSLIAEYYREIGNIIEEKKYLLSVLDYGDDLYANSRLGDIFFEEEDFENALSYFEKTYEMNKNDAALDSINQIKEIIFEEENILQKNSETIDEENIIAKNQELLPEIEEDEDKKIVLPSEKISTKDKEIIEQDLIEDEFVNLKSARIYRAESYYNEGNYADSVKEWKEMLQEESSDPLIWQGLASALSAAGHKERAEQCLSRASELSEKAGALEQFTTDSNEEDLVQAAIQAKQKVSKTSVSEKVTLNESIEWYNKGLTMLTELNAVQALNCFEKVIKSAPREEIELRIRSQNGKGHALYQLERFPDSIQAYHTAISMDPENVNGRTLYNMGSSYAAIEHYEDAMKCFEQAKSRGLDSEDLMLCKTQYNRCKLLKKEQDKHLVNNN